MFKELNFDNLLKVQQVAIYNNGKAICISTSKTAFDDNCINLDPCGNDCKIDGFNEAAFLFVVRLLEHVTGYHFRYDRLDEQMIVWVRTNESVDSGPKS